VNWVQSHSYHLQSGFSRPISYRGQHAELCSEWKVPSTYNGYWGGAGPGGRESLLIRRQKPVRSAAFSGVPLGNSDYKSMQFSVTRRAANGLSLMASYNWSRTHGDVDSDFQEQWWTGSLQNTYDLKDEAKDISDFDETHIVKGYVIYNLPFGRGKQLASNVNSLANDFIGGWSLDGDFHYDTGTPISVHSSNSYQGFNAVYANIVPGCKLNTGTHKLFQPLFNPACFKNPAAAQLGNAGNYQSEVRNPGLATEDLGVHKNLAMGPDGR